MQAYEYLETMPDHDLPQAIVVSDFATFDLVDPRTNASFSFPLADLPKHVRRFGFLIGEQSRAYEEEDPVNRTAAEAMAALHNQLEASRYTGRDLELLLVRIVFCLFADDAQIFERNTFANYLRSRTHADGSDFGPRLVKIFEVLNTPEEERQTTLDQDLQALPYINGGLFEATIRTPDFTSEMRRSVLTAALLDWGKVSPAIFGSMFQGVMDPATRRNLGAHYTSEKNILRVIKPLFLDDLYAEFAKVRERRRDLQRFHQKLSTLHFAGHFPCSHHPRRRNTLAVAAATRLLAAGPARARGEPDGPSKRPCQHPNRNSRGPGSGLQGRRSRMQTRTGTATSSSRQSDISDRNLWGMPPPRRCRRSPPIPPRWRRQC